MAISVATLVEQLARIGFGADILSENLRQMLAKEMDSDEFVTDIFVKDSSSNKPRFGYVGALLGSKDPLKNSIPLTLIGCMILVTSKRLFTIQKKAFLIKERVDKIDIGELPGPLYFYVKGSDIYFIVENNRSLVIDWVSGLNPERFKTAMEILGIGYWKKP